MTLWQKLNSEVEITTKYPKFTLWFLAIGIPLLAIPYPDSGVVSVLGGMSGLLLCILGILFLTFSIIKESFFSKNK